jgi:hypothetical protein
LIQWNLPAAYTAGGETLTNDIVEGKFGLRQVKNVSCDMGLDRVGGKAVKIVFDHGAAVIGSSQGKLRCFQDAQAGIGGTEVPGNFNMSAYTCRMFVEGC